MYASLVTDEQVREKFLGMFLSELEKTREMMLDLLETDIIERRAQHYYSNLLRASTMKDLHAKQVDLLRKWRSEKENGNEEDQNLIALLTTINAIAGAMRNTG